MSLVLLLVVRVDPGQDVDCGEGRDPGDEAPGQQPDVEIQPAQQPRDPVIGAEEDL